MPHSSALRARPFAEEHAHLSNAHEDGVGGNGLNSTSAQTSTEVRTKWLCFLLGCTIFVPWNVLLNGTSFFLFRLADSPFRSTFGSYWSSAYTLSKLACQFYCTITSKQSSSSRRIFTSIGAMIFLVTPMLLSTFIRDTTSIFFPFVLFISVSLAVTSAYLCTAVYAWAGLLGSTFLQNVLAGQSAISVVANAVNVASSVVSLWGPPPQFALTNIVQSYVRDDQPEEVAARIFFIITILFLSITLVIYAWLTGSSFHISGTGTLERCGQARDIGERTQLLVGDCRDDMTVASSHVFQIFKQNFDFMFSIAYTFTVTLAVFPAITVRVESVNPRFHPMVFTAVHFLVFNVGDLIGRSGCSSARLAFWSARKILVASLLRTLFIPIILSCNIHRAATIPLVPLLIPSDVLFMLTMFAMGYTYGSLLTLATLGASSLEHNPRLKGRQENVEVAATLSGTLGIVGLAVGSLSSFAVQAAI